MDTTILSFNEIRAKCLATARRFVAGYNERTVEGLMRERTKYCINEVFLMGEGFKSMSNEAYASYFKEIFSVTTFKILRVRHEVVDVMAKKVAMFLTCFASELSPQTCYEYTIYIELDTLAEKVERVEEFNELLNIPMNVNYQSQQQIEEGEERGPFHARSPKRPRHESQWQLSSQRSPQLQQLQPPTHQPPLQQSAHPERNWPVHQPPHQTSSQHLTNPGRNWAMHQPSRQISQRHFDDPARNEVAYQLPQQTIPQHSDYPGRNGAAYQSPRHTISQHSSDTGRNGVVHQSPQQTIPQHADYRGRNEAVYQSPQQEMRSPRQIQSQNQTPQQRPTDPRQVASVQAAAAPLPPLHHHQQQSPLPPISLQPIAAGWRGASVQPQQAPAPAPAPAHDQQQQQQQHEQSRLPQIASQLVAGDWQDASLASAPAPAPAPASAPAPAASPPPPPQQQQQQHYHQQSRLPQIAPQFVTGTMRTAPKSQPSKSQQAMNRNGDGRQS